MKSMIKNLLFAFVIASLALCSFGLMPVAGAGDRWSVSDEMAGNDFAPEETGLEKWEEYLQPDLLKDPIN